MLGEFQSIGKCLWDRGLISYSAGNMSIRTSAGLIITKRGAPLGFLDESLLVEGPVDKDIDSASVELPVHQAVYKKTDADAVIHAHPPFSIILSLLHEKIGPVDSEGTLLIGEIPVIIVKKPSGSTEVAEAVAEILKTKKIVLVRGHGTFARGKSLKDAFSPISTLEASCRIICGLMTLNR